MLAFEGVVAEALVDDGDEGMALDVTREVKVTMRFADVPLLLKLCGGFSII